MKDLKVTSLLEKCLDKDFILFAKNKDGNINGMTCGWLTGGVLYIKEVLCVYVRKSRHTYNFISESDYFTIATVDNREITKYFGTVSGRDEDKNKKFGFTFTSDGDKITLDQAKLNVVLKIVNIIDYKEKEYLDSKLDEIFKETLDPHMCYIGTIEGIYEK